MLQPRKSIACGPFPVPLAQYLCCSCPCQINRVPLRQPLTQARDDLPISCRMKKNVGGPVPQSRNKRSYLIHLWYAQCVLSGKLLQPTCGQPWLGSLFCRWKAKPKRLRERRAGAASVIVGLYLVHDCQWVDFLGKRTNGLLNMHSA